MRVIKNQIATSTVKTAPDELCVTDSIKYFVTVQTKKADITEEVKCNCPLVFVLE